MIGMLLYLVIHVNAAAVLLQEAGCGYDRAQDTLEIGPESEVIPAERQLFEGWAESIIGAALLDTLGNRGSYGESFIFTKSCESKDFALNLYVLLRLINRVVRGTGTRAWLEKVRHGWVFFKFTNYVCSLCMHVCVYVCLSTSNIEAVIDRHKYFGEIN